MAAILHTLSTTENYTTSTYIGEKPPPSSTTAGNGTAEVLSEGIAGIVEFGSKGFSVTSGQGNETSEQSTILPLQEYQTQTPIREIVYNGTGYYLEDDGDTGLNDIQTLFLACFATLLFLALIVFAALGIRMLWRNYQRTKDSTKYDGILHREGTSESISKPLHSHLYEAEKNLTETHSSILNTEEVEICQGIETISQIMSNNHSNTNGSIITMTMKNNHLIVETEERNDLEEDSRETTMKYSPGAKDGIFVVEVQQGVRRSPSSAGHTTCTEPVSMSVSDQCALVHNPPERKHRGSPIRYSDEEALGEYDDEEYYVDTTSPGRDTPDSLLSRLKTGLAQSDTSISNPSYCYSNQQCYDMGSYGYTYGYTEQNRLYSNPPKMADDTLPKITAAIYKNTLKRSPSTEDLHVAAMRTDMDEIENDSSRRSSNGENQIETQTRMLDILDEELLETNENEVTSTLVSEEHDKADKKCADFSCNELTKS